MQQKFYNLDGVRRS